MLSLLFLCRVIKIIFTLCHYLWTRTRYVRVFLPVIALFPLLDAARRLPPKRAGCATVVEKSSLLFVLFFIGSDIDSRLRPSWFLINNSKDRPMILEYLTPPVTAQMLRTSASVFSHFTCHFSALFSAFLLVNKPASQTRSQIYYKDIFKKNKII